MTPDKIVAKFSAALNQFEPIHNQPSDTDLTRLQEAVALLLLQIPYNEKGRDTQFIQDHSVEDHLPQALRGSFPQTQEGRGLRPRDQRRRCGNCQRTPRGSTQGMARGRATFETVRQETTQFVLAVFVDIWVWELRDLDTIYTEVDP